VSQNSAASARESNDSGNGSGFFFCLLFSFCARHTCLSPLMLYERILRFYPNQKAIIATGYSLTADVKATQKLGAGQFLKKPFTLEKLGIAVRDELAR